MVQAIGNNATRAIGVSGDAIDHINEFAKQYHTAGRAIKNIGRLMAGKEPTSDVKEAGAIAKTLSAPHRANIAIQNGIKKAAGNVAQAVDGLDAAAAKQAERTRERKPSLLGNLAAKKEIVAQKKLDLPAPERAKTAGLEV
jgi:hypothetical protein